MQITGNPADNIIFPQIFPPFFRNGVFSVQNTQNIACNGSRGIAVPCDIDRFRDSRSKIPFITQGTENTDRHGRKVNIVWKEGERFWVKDQWEYKEVDTEPYETLRQNGEDGKEP